MNKLNNSFAFVFGREQEIALAELKAVLRRFCFSFDIKRISGNVAFINIDNFSESDAIEVMNALAGTIKIFRIEHTAVRIQSLSNIIFQLKGKDSAKFNFGISSYSKEMSKDKINKLGINLKMALKKNGLKTRFVALTQSEQLSTIQSLKNNLVQSGIEIGIFQEADRSLARDSYSLGILCALNNPEDWNKRDYGKPAFDKYSGMVPPKLARMMVNLAIGELNCKLKNGKLNDIVVLDPFCGSGNILMEAMLLGCNVIGSDISEKAVEDTKKNLGWLIQISNLKSQNEISKFKIFQSDATGGDYTEKISSDLLILNTKYLILVCEPYLGQPKKFKPSYNAAIGEYSKIKELYLDFLKNFKSLSSSGSVVQLESEARGSKLVDSGLHGNDKKECRTDRGVVLCLVFPLVETSDKGRFSLFSQCVDEIKKMGYTQACKSFVYGRDYQVVKREIVLLRQEDTSSKKQ